MGAPVGGGRKALGETALFELVQHAHQARALDPEPVGQVRLRQSGIGGDHDAGPEYCAGRMSTGASVRMKSWNTQTCRRRMK